VREGKIPQEWNDYKLASKFGWTEDQILAQRAQWIDWLLELMRVEDEVEYERKKRAGDG
jgi:hypothetical protein